MPVRDSGRYKRADTPTGFPSIQQQVLEQAALGLFGMRIPEPTKLPGTLDPDVAAPVLADGLVIEYLNTRAAKAFGFESVRSGLEAVCARWWRWDEAIRVFTQLWDAGVFSGFSETLKGERIHLELRLLRDPRKTWGCVGKVLHPPETDPARQVELLRSAFDAMDDPMLILDPRGNVECANRSWGSLAELGHWAAFLAEPGLDARAVCEQTARQDSPEAGRVATAIQEVIAGRQDEVLLEYGWSGPDGPRAFRVRVRRVRGASGIVLVSHLDVTHLGLTPPEVGGGRRGPRTVLLVEDERSVRDLLVDVLQRNGYTVLSAGDGVEAQRVSNGHGQRIDLLLAGLVRDEDGDALAERLLKERPDLRVLFVAGSGTPQATSLDKPFSPDDLLHKMREVLA